MSVLIKELSLTFQRDVEGSPGYWNLSGKWVEGSKVPVVVEGSLQPYSMGKSQITLPEGIFAEDTLVFYSKDEVRTADQFGLEKADTVLIDGRTYVCHKAANWNRLQSSLSKHYKTLLVRKDKATGGTL